MQLFRALEAVLPLAALRTFLSPVAATLATFDSLAGAPITSNRGHLLKGNQPPERDDFWRTRVDFHLTRSLNFIPDRLGENRWRKRLKFHFSQDVKFLPNDSTPVVLATLHFGPLHLMRYFLRAHGYSTMTLIEDAPHARSPIKRCKDTLSDAVTGMTSVPQVISRHDLFKLRHCLTPGRQIMISVDHNTGRQLEVETEWGHFRMATGALRLAARLQARVIPCLIAESAPWEFTIHFGAPVPAHYLNEPTDLEAAAQHLIAEFMPVLARYPEQVASELRECVKPSASAERQRAADCVT